MKNLNLLLTTYHEAFVIKGGGEYELLSIAEGLRMSGIAADIYGPYSRALETYDLVLHFSVDQGGLKLLRLIREKGLPILLWPNLWTESIIDEGSINVIQEHVALANYVIFKSKAEECHFTRLVNVPEQKLRRCRIVADISYMNTSTRKLFPELYNIQDYGLCLGLIELRKKQLSIIEALRSVSIPLVLVGKYREKDYYELCQSAGAEGVLFIENLPQRSEIVRSAFQNSLFYVELSSEPAGLSAIEAGLSGCRLLLSDTEWSREHFLNYAEYVDPDSEQSIVAGIKRVLSRPKDNRALQNHASQYCYPYAMAPLIEVIRKVLT